MATYPHSRGNRCTASFWMEGCDWLPKDHLLISGSLTPTSCRTRNSQKLCERSRLSVIVLVLCLALFALPSTVASQAPDPSEDIQKYLNVIDSAAPYGQVASGKQPISVMWGIADTTATLGRLFQYTLPKEAFSGEVTTYKVTEAGKDQLPPWLLFEDATSTVKGVPGEDEVGQEYTIEVTAIGQFSNDAVSQAKDVFTVNILEDDALSVTMTTATPLKEATNNGMKPIRCSEGSPVTMVTIIVDADMTLMMPHQKVGMMDGMCSHLGIPSELPRMMPVGNRPMFDSSALVAGPGDVKRPQEPGMMVQWEVGCGNVNANHMPILQQVEETSHDGRMSKAVGHGIVGWHVTNNRPHMPLRMKRQVAIMPTATIMPTMGPPTRLPVPTMFIDETDQPVTRVVPTMASPTFPGEIQPTKIKTKHHHRTKKKKVPTATLR